MAYVFVHPLPGPVADEANFAGRHVYLIAPLGLTVFYGPDRLVKLARSPCESAPVRGGRGAKSAV